jgi:hypothetical protein
VAGFHGRPPGRARDRVLDPANRVSVEPPILRGDVDPRIAAELPGIGLRWCEFEVTGDVSRRSPDALRRRIRELSDRARGAQAIALRSRAIPHAYRVLFRHLGMEPDETRIPVEEYMLERLRRGVYPSRGVLADALMVATIETEVGVWACSSVGSLRLALDAGRVVVADRRGVVAPVFSVPPAVSGGRVVLYAVVAAGVPEIAVEEALWTAWDLVTA